MTDGVGGASGLEQFREVETGEAFTIQNMQLVKVELSSTTVMARSGAMVAYQGDVRFEHKGGGMGRLLKKAATGESLRLMTASGSGEMFLANQAMLVHVIRLSNEALTVNGANILAFEEGIEWDIKRVKGGAAGCSREASSTSTSRAAARSRCAPTGSRSSSTSPRPRRSPTRRPRSPGRVASRRASRPTCRPRA